jgi:oxygen-dependent protoporphyrinogen oxidase
MIGTLNTSDKRVTIIGAGISGLLIGYILKKKGYQVTIHEKSNRVGGLIQTKHISHGMVETAAHSILVNEEIQKFMDELGVELLSINPDSKARYIYRNGKMRRMPLTIFEIFSTLFHFFSKPKLTKPLDQLTLEEWGNAYLGKAATQYLLGPFTAGIFACLPSNLNAKLSFPKLIPSSGKISLFQHLRSLRKKPKTKRAQMMVFKNGTEDLILKLHQALKSEIQLNSNIHEHQSIEGNLILSTPSPEIEYSPLVTATVFISKNAFTKKEPKGVGVLIPRGENIRMLGCLFNSSAFSGRVNQEQETSLTVMYGGTSDPTALQIQDADLKTLIDQELRQLLGTNAAPAHIEITKWPKAIPIYSSKLTEYIQHLSQTFSSKPGKMVFTNFSGQVSIRGMIETTLIQ